MIRRPVSETQCDWITFLTIPLQASLRNALPVSDPGPQSLPSLGGSFPGSHKQLHFGTFDAGGSVAIQLIRLGLSLLVDYDPELI